MSGLINGHSPSSPSQRFCLLLISLLTIHCVVVVNIHSPTWYYVSAQYLAHLVYCSVANTTLIPASTMMTRQQPGILCPFGYIKQTNVSSGTFICVSVRDLLTDLVDRKDCVLPPGRNEFSLPYLDPLNCIFNFMYCATSTKKCSLFNTRKLGDSCVDRHNCVGSLQKPYINCHEGICTTLKPLPVLPVGSVCSVNPTAENLAFISYQNNTFATCSADSSCMITLSGSSKCVKKHSQKAQPYASCGLVYENQEGGQVVESIKECVDGHVCNSNCVPNYGAPDFGDVLRFPFRSVVPFTNDPKKLIWSSTFMSGRKKYVPRGKTMCTNTDYECNGASTDNAIQIKSSYSYMRKEAIAGFQGLSKCDLSQKQCQRAFSLLNGHACNYHSECRSTYCSPKSNQCEDIPSHIPCGPNSINASVSECPGLSQCVCANLTSAYCVNLCFAELTDLRTCAYNFGVFGISNPISKMESTLIPFFDSKSSIFSFENGTCRVHLRKYYSCMQNAQQELGLNIQQIVHDEETPQNVRSVKEPIDSGASSEGFLDEPDDMLQNLYLQGHTQWSSSLNYLVLAEMNSSYVPKPIHNISDISLATIDLFNDPSNRLNQISPIYSNVNVSEQVVVYILERMAGLIPRYKSKAINFNSTLNVCGCCTPQVTQFLQSSLTRGIILKGNDSNILTQGAVNFQDLSLSNTISGFEPIMGHDSFLNRNWYEKCDIILVPPEDIDVITLSIKNNMLIFDNNETSGDIVKELEQKTMKDLFLVLISNLPSKMLTLSRDVRDAAMTDEQVLRTVSSLIQDTIIQSMTRISQIFNQVQNSNSSECSLFNATFDVKTYHQAIFSFSSEWDSTLFPLAYSEFIIEFDNWFFAHGISLPKFNVTNDSMIAILDKLANPKCYSSYNSYLGVFHYNDASKYWDLILKDAMLWCVIACCVIFYIIVAFTYRASFAMKRRLFAPFIGPFCILIICLVYIEPILMSLFKSVGKNIVPFIPIPNLCMSLLSASYIAVSVRFYYLRNLYPIRKGLDGTMQNRTANSSMKLYRIIAQPFVTFLITMIIMAALFAIWFGIFYGILDRIIIKSFGRFEWTLQFDASLLAITTQFVFLSVTSILCLTVDAIFNWKKIKKNGIGYYFMFDDPFHMRIDIISQLLIFIISIIVILDIFVWHTLIVNRIGIALYFLCTLMIFGGNIVAIELVALLRKKRESTFCFACFTDRPDVLETEWMSNMKDVEFRGLQQTYAKNEFSLENFIMFEHLESLEKKKEINVDDMQNLQSTFLHTLSPYAVNLPASCHTRFDQLLEKLVQESVSTLPIRELDFIKNEVIANNLDTFSRLTSTTEYRRWKEVASFQKEMHVK
ncbi:hypothetical protein C9374_003618 [Naegleria lovaniensis]|uniref:RGS domain-containing protein n=1 Tax=Naegleria lovaniensis TaxID=51637 RepID=A0AA88H078_NAELO|nr:uncharacterized protein C9374_003618 [Naegleria lovaniensis]KAG2393854.1 hypothetical protein C9374_003618 [Naegleria lovaniensis]